MSHARVNILRTAAAALAGLAALSRPLAGQCPDGTQPPCRTPAVATPRAAAAPPPQLSIAVLPFANRSPDTTDAYLAEGMTEEIANRLAQLGRLQVKARTLVAAQWRRTPDPFDAARRLNVAWFVHGNVRHAGAQLLVNVELVRATTGEEAWAARFPRSAGDVFAVQAEVAESVAVVVGGRLSPGERAAIARRPTRNNEAYRLLLLGQSLLKRRTTQEAERALEAFTQAVRLDSGFAPGWAGIGQVRSVQASWSWSTMSSDSLRILAHLASQRALALDSASVDAWTVECATLTEEGELWRAHRSCARALHLDSLNAEVWHQYGDLYGSEVGLGEVARAEQMYRRSVALDPDFGNVWRHLAVAVAHAGRLAEGEALLDTSVSLGPPLPARCERAYVRYLRGNAPAALADLPPEGPCENWSNPGLPVREIVAIARGDTAPARAVLAQLRAQADSRRSIHGILARLSVALGLREDALSALERHRVLVDPREPRCTPTTTCSVSLATWRLLQDPIFAPLRGEPRFIRLLEQTQPRVPWR